MEAWSQRDKNPNLTAVLSVVFAGTASNPSTFAG
jgi:hypothetical protein